MKINSNISKKKIDKMISDLIVNKIKLMKILGGKNENIYM